MRPSAPLLAALLLTGCATLDERECRHIDWYQLGARDGGFGYGERRIEEHREACSAFGLDADASAWRQGHAAGLQDFCTADNGYRVGRRGGYYGQVCPRELEPDFLDAYELGRETYEVEAELSELGRRIDSLEARLISDGVEDSTRREIRRQLVHLYEHRLWLRRSVDRLEREWRRRLDDGY